MTTTRSTLKHAAEAAISALEPAVDAIGTRRSIVIEQVDPELDCGAYPVKRVVGDDLRVSADIFADGHDLLDAVLLLRREEEATWTETPMRLVDNDRWSGTVRLRGNAPHRYTIEAWRDAIGSWRETTDRKVAAGLSVGTELAQGRALLEEAKARTRGADARLIEEALARDSRARTERTRAAALGADPVLAAARRHPDRSAATRYPRELPLTVDRELARCSAWYELFPRSQGRDPAHPAPTTLADAEWRLADIAAMGFDVVYLPPIHPIGRTNRKGRDNSLAVRRGDPGSPWAIGRDGGGHTAVAAELGGLEAFDHFRRAAEQHGLEVALDLALQASPDHPWVVQHPEWFSRAPDGSIRHAENPPKVYQDIYPFDFAGPVAAGREALWHAWLEVVLTWVERGVRIFRVDNPHTKPVAFWRWLIAEVQRRDSRVIFLSEAFTKPKRMRALAKAGFTQSYTYFTWRETPDELREYLVELTEGPMREYFRGNLWPNTPDIYPHHLDAGRPAFAVRGVLAATLSSAWGIYSGFELCEQGRLGEREEYGHSEKYEIRSRDWDAPGSIKVLISALNRLRHEWRALQLYDNLRFEDVTGQRALFYRKALPATDLDPLTGFPGRWRDPVYVAVNCDPTRPTRAVLHPDLPAIGIGWDEPYLMVDLLTGRSRRLRGAAVAVELDPARLPYRVFTIRPVTRPAGGVTDEPGAPLGATPEDGGTTFRLWSEHAEGVDLCLYNADGGERQLRLARGAGHVWAVTVPGVGEGQRYGYRVQGAYEPEHGNRFSPAKLVLDPYARRVEGPLVLREEHFAHLDGEGHAGRPRDDRDSSPFTPKSVVARPLPMVDDAERPWTPIADSVIYELHVKGFTRLHPDLPEAMRGTYAGLAHPAVLAHLHALGVTAVELLPVQQQLTRRFLLERGLVDYWGYNTIAFLAPDPRFAATDDPRAELREAIRALHADGIEVILDVVYNHTGEGDEHGPTVAFRGIDNAGYYRLDPADPRRYLNDAGTGNTLDATHPAVMRLVLDSLHVFADEYGADGFRFDLATVLGRGLEGFSAEAPLFAAIAADPRLARLKLIAEPWDLGAAGYRLGHFPAGWSEWNGQYRDTVRRFWAGAPDVVPDLALRLAGSPDLFPVATRGPASSVNYVTSHDGFTLRDLVSYAEKHNLANSEEDGDGEDDNDSLNFGVEGDTTDAAILDRRDRQRRALLATLLTSRGATMLMAGDELGRTQLGNNNAYSHDDEVSWLNWMPGPRDDGLLHFVRALVSLRHAHPLLRSGSLSVLEGPPLRLLLEANDPDPRPDAALLLALNPTDAPVIVELAGGLAGWQLLLDSGEAEPLSLDAPGPPLNVGASYEMPGRSVVLLARPPAGPA